MAIWGGVRDYLCSTYEAKGDDESLTLVFNVSEGRTQLVIVHPAAEEYDHAHVRFFSPFATVDQPGWFPVKLTKSRKELRHDRILAAFGANPALRVNRLAEELDVSTETIRRDLAELDRIGRLSRTYGGAVSTGSRFEPALNERLGLHVAERQAIARAIRRERPDLVVTTTWDERFGTGMVNQAEHIARRLGHYTAYECKYGATSINQLMPIVRKQGNAILAAPRDTNERFHYFDTGIKRLIIALELDEVCVFLVHLSLKYRQRQEQLRSLHDLIIGNDVIQGGNGNDLITGDHGTIVTPMVNGVRFDLIQESSVTAIKPPGLSKRRHSRRPCSNPMI